MDFVGQRNQCGQVELKGQICEKNNLILKISDCM